MALHTTGSSDYSSISNTVISAARFTEEYGAPMKGLVTPFSMPAGSNTFRVPRFSTVEAAALTEGVDMTESQDLTLSHVDLSTSEAGLKVILTDKMMREVQENMLSICGKVMGDAIARYIDKQLLALLDGFGTALGSAGKYIDEEVVAATVAILQNAKAIGPYTFVMHPFSWYNFTKLVSNTYITYGAGLGMDATDQRVQQFLVGKLAMFGATIWHDANLTIDSSDDVKGGAFGKEALSITTAMEPRNETERDASLRGIEIVHVLDFGVAELLDSSGVELYFDAATPAPAGDS